tara:strand:+ start:460 stop:717 length:258 start_codon:yes stop_codon:yes gene_type:complete
MFDQEALLGHPSSPEGINKIILGIILLGAFNAIFIIYSVRFIYGVAKKEREKLKIQQARIYKLFPNRNRIYASWKTIDYLISIFI